MVQQRLPTVDGDDGQWGDILNQFINKEHFNGDADLVQATSENGGHKTITVQPGTATAGTAPIKLTSGPLMTVPEAGAVEFLTDKFYLTSTTGTARKAIASYYDDGSGATGDIYYRDDTANFVRLPVGLDSDVLTLISGVPAWDSLDNTYQVLSEKNQASGYAGLDADGLLNPAQLLDWEYVHRSDIDRTSSGLGGNTKTSNLISIHAGGTAIDVGAGFGYINDQSAIPETFKKVVFAGGSNIALAGNGSNFVHIDSDGAVVVSTTKLSMSTHIYLGHVYVVSGSIIGSPFNVPEWAGHFPGRVNEFMADAMQTIVADGLDVSEQATLLKLSVSTGELYARLSAIDVDTPVTTFVKMFNNNGSWTVDSNNLNYVNTTQWNNTTSGLVAMTDAYWKKDLVLMTPSKDVYYIFGQAEYATEDLAKKGAIPVIPTELQMDSAYLALIVCQKGDTTIGNRLLNITPNFARIFGYGTEGGGSVVDYNDLINKPLGAAYSNYSLSTGVIEGGVISINADTTKIDITAGSSLYVDNTNPESPVIEVLTWGNLTAQAPTGLATAGRLWVGITRTAPSTGGLVYSTEFTASQKRSIAVLGRVWGNGTTTVEGVGQYTAPAFGVGKTLEDLMHALGSLNISGNVFSPYGTGLTLSKSTGEAFRFSGGAADDIQSPNILVDAVGQTNISSYHYHLAQGTVALGTGFTTLETTIDADYYDAVGTKTAVTTDYFTIQRVYYFPRSGVVDVVYGQTEYSSMADAVSALSIESYVVSDDHARTLDGSILRAFVVVQQGATDLSDIAQAKVFTANSAGGGAASGGSQVNADWNASSGVAQILNKPAVIVTGDSPTLGDVTITGLSGAIITSESVEASIEALDDSIASQKETGFGAWTSGTDADTYTITGGKFQLDRTGYGYINGKKVSWASGQQTGVLSANTFYSVYIDSLGLIQTSTSPFTANTVRLFEVLYDGTNYMVAKENHSKEFTSAVSGYLHKTIGTIIAGTGAVVTRVATGTGASADDRRVKIVGTDTLSDHGLETAITADNPVTWNVFYRNGSGKWVRDSQVTELPIKYNNAGTPTALGSAPNFGIYTLYVMKDNIESAAPQYLAVMGETSSSSAADALAIITAGTAIYSTNELKNMESAQLGYAIVQYSATGGYIEELQVAKSTLNQQLVGGAAGSDHAVMTNLDYASSGHTGFMPSSQFSIGTAKITIGTVDPQATAVEGDVWIDTN